ncbi:MAG: peptidylprolyl isomerase [Chitinophagaceae bacterium]|nr:MAG: peptidylprolyl isomerase [Chitinophagaceae bacterium]
MIRKLLCFTFLAILLAAASSVSAQKETRLRKKDRKRDVLIETTMGDMVFRLSDSTPLHRDNFLLLVKKHYYDSLLFHRVINNFMIQAGDPDSRGAQPGIALGEGGPGFKVPAEFRQTIFHKNGTLAAAREGDNVNPSKASSGSQFYIVKGRVFTPAGLDSLENNRLKYKLSPAQREAYTTVGGTPHLDGNYTAFGEMTSGFDILDKISSSPTSQGKDHDRPLQDIMIIRAKLVKRKK